MIEFDRLPVVLQNVRANRGWRPQDMINWHRMVRPLRGMAAAGGGFDFYHMIFDCCTSFAVQYKPRTPATPGLHAGEAFEGSGEKPVVCFVDAPDHVSGVATTLREWSNRAAARREAFVIFHSGDRDLFRNGLRFEPVGTLELGVYGGMQLHVPQVAAVLAAARRRGCRAVHVSTPGPMGLLGLVVARELGVPVVGTFHTDFPSYAARLTGDYRLEHSTWRFMRWFYGQLDRVAAPSASTRDRLTWNGIDADKLTVVGRGIDTERFSPDHRDIALRTEWGGARHDWLLYVGRLSREKNLDCLIEAFRAVSARRADLGLVIVGDGPCRAELEEAARGMPVVFTGMRKGPELSRIYASCDLFVFPSETDTLGVVLLEAQASGLPVLVSSEGGPKDCMLHGETGHIVKPMNPGNLARSIEQILRDRPQHAEMGRRARAWALRHTPERSFDAFWNLHGVAPATAEVA